MIAQLLCEGVCNAGRIRLIDGMIRKWRSTVRAIKSKLEPVDDQLYAHCSYTPHVWVDAGTWRCETCGHRRQWGVRS
jgi:hypothetical protein